MPEKQFSHPVTTATPEATVSKRAVRNFSSWLNTTVTQCLRNFEGKYELVTPLEHKKTPLGGELCLRRTRNGQILVEARFNQEVVSYLVEVKNHNVVEFSDERYETAKSQVGRPEMGPVVKRWCEIEKGQGGLS